MTLASMNEIVKPAREAGYGVGAFNVIQIEHAEAIVAGAERAGSSVILQISENAIRYHGALPPIGLATLAVARAAQIPVAVHLDHATSQELVRESIALGFTSVMFDASAFEYDENVVATARVAALCRESGVSVEAELGEIGGKDGVHAPGARTNPVDAAAFVHETGVDALAVAVGTSHAMLSREAVLDVQLIRQLSECVPVPLVLHGSSGVPDAGLAAAVKHGMTKINIATHLNKAFTHAVREKLASDETLVDTRAYLGAGREAVEDEVARLLGVLGSVG